MKYLITRDSLKECKVAVLIPGNINENFKNELNNFLKSHGFIVKNNISGVVDLMLGQINEVNDLLKDNKNVYSIIINDDKLNNDIKKQIINIDKKISYQKGLI